MLGEPTVTVSWELATKRTTCLRSKLPANVEGNFEIYYTQPDSNDPTLRQHTTLYKY